MSDRTSGGIFADLLCWADERNDADLVHKLYDESRKYDFSWCDYNVDPVLGKYDLTRSVWNERYNEWETVENGDRGFDNASPYRAWNAPPPNMED